MSEAPERFVDLVFEGGGTKGIAHVGALAVLEERGYAPQTMAGTSIGAVVAALRAAGYTPPELRELLDALDLGSFRDTAWEDRVPLAGALLSVLKDQGIYEGAAFQAWVGGLLRARGVETFRDLVHPDHADEPRYRYRVQVIASDITARRMLVLPHDAPLLGVAPDDLDVSLALRMSTSIPIFFEPVRVAAPPDGAEHLIVDGGILSNYPVWLFDVAGVPEWPTFGLLLTNASTRTPTGELLPVPPEPVRGADALLDYLQALVATIKVARDARYVEQADFARTITIPTLGISSTDLDITPEQAEALYQSGRTAAEDFLASWDFAGYIAAFRTGKPHSRRRQVAEQMRHVAVR